MNIAHMDIGSRNARLYEHLKAMGLYVIPVFSDEDNTQIDHFHVSAGLPKYLTRDIPAVSEPVPSAQIVHLVRPEDSVPIPVGLPREHK